MKRTVFAVCLLALAVSCKNKRANSDSEQTEPSTAPTEAPAPAPQAEAKPAEPPKQKELPAPSDVAAPPATADKSSSGLAWTILEKGTGTEKPTPADRVQVHYSGWTADGKMFDSSVVRGQPTTFGVTQVIKGWTEGLQLMTEGEKRRFWIPADLAYGDTARRPGAPTGQLTFDVELIKILSAPKAPTDVAAPSAGSKKTASGLSYKVLQEGDGATPGPENRVTVHYSGWTADGKMFDSSVPRGNPSTFGVGQVIKGWTEGLQLMKAGAKYRFWIPADLAYGETPSRPGAPAGQLTFDVELLEVK
jgi:peptidylprolyl isomerase